MFLLERNRELCHKFQCLDSVSVTYYSYVTLCRSPLVGVDKETLVTCTISFPRKGRRRKELWQLIAIRHDRSYLSLDSTKES
jgi:hypothetical protein